MANKTFNTRVKNKRDTAANWEAVATTFQPLDGELIIVDTSAGKTRFKVGRYDTAKGRLLYYNEIPFADEYLYNDLNESQGKIYDTIKGIDDKSIIEMTLEPAGGNGATELYKIGLWQFSQSGFYKIKFSVPATSAIILQGFARETGEDGTTNEDFSTSQLKIYNGLGGDAQTPYVFVLADCLDNDSFTSYHVQFLNLGSNLGRVYVNTYDKSTQKWSYVCRKIVEANKVSNALTLTKGDITTEFNGSTAQTVSIPTKTSELTNDSDFTTQNDLDNLTNTVVSYNAQENITDEQKAQARTNIGAISSSEVSSNYLSLDDTQVLTEIQQDVLKNKLGYINRLKVLSNWVEAVEQCKKESGCVLVIQGGEHNDGDIIPDIAGDAYPLLLIPARVRSTNLVFHGTDAYGNNNYLCSISYPSFKFNVTKLDMDQQTMKADPTEDMQIATKKYVDNSSVQSDWNQNDETAKDYVKNRPGAYFSDETIEITQSLENLTWHTQNTLKVVQIQRTDIPNKLYENIPYEICWGNEKYYVKLTSIEGQLKFGDTDNDSMPIFTNYPFFISLVPSNSLSIVLPNTSTPPSSISIKFNQGLVKLSEGYIDQVPGKISLYNTTSTICSVDTLEIGVIEDNKFYGVENNRIGYLPTSNGVSGGLALFSPIPPFNQTRMTWSGADSLSQYLSNSKSFSGNFGDNVQENVYYNQALSEIHRYSYTLDHCRANIGFAGNDYYNFKLYCDTTTSTKAIPTAIGYTVKNNKIYQLKVTANNLSTNGQVDFVFTEFLDLDAIASKSDIPIIDTALSSTSENAIQNKAVKTAIDSLQTAIDGKVDITALNYGLTQVINDIAANYVKFTAEQTLTDEQKAQARDNINAPSPADAVYTATASSTDGVAYTATVSGIDSLTVGASFIMIPNKASTSKAPTLNVNGLGAKPIRRRLSSLTTSLQQGHSTNWIALNKPFTVVYDGTAWVIEGLTKTDGADVYGAVAQATADAEGNNIADTYATIAMLQSLLPKVTTITLTSNWVGDASPYYQDIALSCVTETSIVDLQPTPEQLNSWQDDGIAFTTLSGNGTVRVYVAGGKPSSAISVQVRVQEVTVI